MTTFTATYSPEDNKLRLYASSRLDKELYERVRAAGFRWAPKQELFVAPMWTPERAALLEELAEEIGDEDTSLVERAEERAGRFDEYSGKRAADSAAASEAVRRIADGIPFGQPILVGHHSERRARKDAERIENGMRKAVKLWETAEYWTQRAAGALAHAKYLERPDVRMRRIARIEADKRKVERSIAKRKALFRLWEKIESPNSVTRKDGAETTFMERALYAANCCHYSQCFKLADYPRDPPASQYEGQMGLWSALDGGVITPAQAREIAMRVYGRATPGYDAWLQHYEFRLAYERAMLAEQTAADPKPKYEKGGAVRCWAGPRGGWAYIQKVNKVSVTVLDNWGNGGRDFTRTIPFDKCQGVMSAAEVQEARDTEQLVHVDNTGFRLRNAPLPEKREQDPPAPDIAAMRASLKAGVEVAVAPQLFPTPPAVAERMAELADIEPGARVLEPSAGTGNLVEAVLKAQPDAHVEIVELNLALADALASKFKGRPVIPGDFLEKTDFELGGKVDRVVMNPPFERGADIKHILRARELLKPGGRLVAICADGPRQKEKLEPLADYWEPLPEGTFAGTGVRTVLLTMEAA